MADHGWDSGVPAQSRKLCRENNRLSPVPVCAFLYQAPRPSKQSLSLVALPGWTRAMAEPAQALVRGCDRGACLVHCPLYCRYGSVRAQITAFSNQPQPTTGRQLSNPDGLASIEIQPSVIGSGVRPVGNCIPNFVYNIGICRKGNLQESLLVLR